MPITFFIEKMFLFFDLIYQKINPFIFRELDVKNLIKLPYIISYSLLFKNVKKKKLDKKFKYLFLF